MCGSMDRTIATFRSLRHLITHPDTRLLLELAAPICTLLLAQAGLTLYNSTQPKTAPIHRSPRNGLPPSSASLLPYPPDALPGARDVPSPFGSIRVYEWGPVTGRKVLFIHGISTPCIAFASLARHLVDRAGCRVILFDLFGRGYSDAPDPQVYRQDMGLWSAQILTVLASSELSWTGGGADNRFTIVGYSMGGGIGASFASYYPSLVESLVLIAPGGLIRHSRIATSSKLLYSGALPSSMVDFFVRRRLVGNKPYQPPEDRERKTVSDAAASELPADDHPAMAPDSLAPIFPDRPTISIASAVAWQMSAHPGFLPSFISSIRYAPVSDEHDRWKTIGERCRVRREERVEALPGLDENKVLVLLGKDDGVIVADEIEEDAQEALGRENVKVVRLDGGHDVPVVNAAGCCAEILAFWGDSVV